MKKRDKTIITGRNITKCIVSVFAVLFVCCIIGGLWNPVLFFFAAMCGAMINVGLKDLKKEE